MQLGVSFVQRSGGGDVTGRRRDSAKKDASSPAESVLDGVQDVAAEAAFSTPPVNADGSTVVLEPPQVTPALSVLTPAGLALVAVAGGLTCALLTTWIIRQGTSVPLVDVRIHTWVVSDRNSASTVFARAVTWGGVTTVVLPALIAIGALAVKGGTDIWRRLGAGVLLSGIASVGVFVGLRINALVGRERPSVADWAGAAGGPAFPSGHTTAATLFAASCAWALAARVRAGWPRRAIWAGAVVYAGAVGWSRVWLGVHWPTDVLGGWLVGLTWFTGAAAVTVALRRRAVGRRAARA